MARGPWRRRPSALMSERTGLTALGIRPVLAHLADVSVCSPSPGTLTLTGRVLQAVP